MIVWRVTYIDQPPVHDFSVSQKIYILASWLSKMIYYVDIEDSKIELKFNPSVGAEIKQFWKTSGGKKLSDAKLKWMVSRNQTTLSIFLLSLKTTKTLLSPKTTKIGKYKIREILALS